LPVERSRVLGGFANAFVMITVNYYLLFCRAFPNYE